MIDGRMRVWRETGQDRLNEECVQQREQFGGGSVMIWAGISEDGKTDLVVLEGGVTADVYINEILRPVVVPYAAAVGEGFYLMQDNATPHTARRTAAFLETEGIDTLEWPSRSPDLNPLENLWDGLKRSVNKRIKPDTTLQQLRRIIIREWDKLGQDDIRCFIRSMRRRVVAVIEANGGHTKY